MTARLHIDILRPFADIAEALAWIESQAIYRCPYCQVMTAYKDGCTLCVFNRGFEGKQEGSKAV